ncbi:MAG: GNAT family N-acetyltransferase [Abyssibacter sp.]|uniref:GNAT family N-acetyltransferase n=1 Tax=Abyssibacter sp. TaxID=2320200 RepID=UPI00321991FB
MFHIRPACPADWPAIWSVLEPVFRQGDTYAVDRDISEHAARRDWCSLPLRTFVACDATGQVLGTSIVKANQRGGGRHVANAAFVVDQAARGRGVAATLCVHAQDSAHALGFTAMQFNFVVATNLGAVRLWKRLGFAIVGTLPSAFDHPVHGCVDAHVMHKSLTGSDSLITETPS